MSTAPTSIAIARTTPDRIKARVEGDIVRTRTMHTAIGGVLVTVTVRDQSGEIDCLVFPKRAADLWPLLMCGRVVVEGAIEHRGVGNTRLLVDSVEAVGPPVGDWRLTAAVAAAGVGEA